MGRRQSTLVERMPQRAIPRKLPKDKKKGRPQQRPAQGSDFWAYLPDFFFMGIFSMTISVPGCEKVAPAGTR